MSDQPVLPYGGTSGHAGSETSKQRAVSDDTSGRTGARQRTTLRLLGNAGAYGLTYRELGDRTGWHHGQSSGVLSGLHKAGRIVRLTETRGRCKVYCLPLSSTVLGRPTEQPSKVARPGLGPVADEMARLLRVQLDVRDITATEISAVLAEYDRIVHR